MFSFDHFMINFIIYYFQPLLGNVTFIKGVRRFLYAVTPQEASFAKLGDVPNYLNEVRICIGILKSQCHPGYFRYSCFKGVHHIQNRHDQWTQFLETNDTG